MNDKDIFRINLIDIYNRNNFFTSLKNIDKLLILENKSENTYVTNPSSRRILF